MGVMSKSHAFDNVENEETAEVKQQTGNADERSDGLSEQQIEDAMQNLGISPTPEQKVPANTNSQSNDLHSDCYAKPLQVVGKNDVIGVVVSPNAVATNRTLSLLEGDVDYLAIACTRYLKSIGCAFDLSNAVTQKYVNLVSDSTFLSDASYANFVEAGRGFLRR